MELIFDTTGQYLACCALLALAQTVYVVFGFGVGLIAVGTLALLLPEIRDVVVLLFFVSLPAELYVVAKGWRRVPWRSLTLICSGIALGVPLGTWILRRGEPTFLLTLLGVVLIGSGGAFLLVKGKRRGSAPTWVKPPVGLASGVLAGLFGTGGPPLILYYQLMSTDKTAFRRNLMAIFLLVTAIRLSTYAVSGLLTAPRLWSGLAVVPAALFGTWLGNRIHVQLSEDRFRRLVSVALMLIGALLLAR